VGLLAETSKALKQAVIPYLKQFLQIALKALGHDEDQIKRNAAYMCGALCQSAGAESVQYYQEILRRLVPLFTSTEPALSDNACGAAARMILNSPESVPLEHVRPPHRVVASSSSNRPMRITHLTSSPLLTGAAPDVQGAADQG
jgi:hypothetical protein